VDTATERKPGRNEPCHCGSGRKYKQCCLEKDAAAEREERAQAAATAEAPPVPAGEEIPAARPPKHQTYQPWKKSATNTHGFHRVSTPRKVGGS
jgi:hypothetical protein